VMVGGRHQPAGDRRRGSGQRTPSRTIQDNEQELGRQDEAQRDSAGASWTAPRPPMRPDLHDSSGTDTGRTQYRPHAARNRESAGQMPFRWAWMNGL
jgi:hypothetical protein